MQHCYHPCRETNRAEQSIGSKHRRGNAGQEGACSSNSARTGSCLSASQIVSRDLGECACLVSTSICSAFSFR